MTKAEELAHLIDRAADHATLLEADLVIRFRYYQGDVLVAFNDEDEMEDIPETAAGGYGDNLDQALKMALEGT